MSTGTDPVGRALGFLAARQHPSGTFGIRVGLSLEEGESASDDASLFATSVLATALWRCGDGRAQALARKTAAPLREHMEAPGVWRHWTAEHEQFHALPADADDTACISDALRAQGVAFPDNRALLLANRDRHGHFRTWLIARPSRHAGLWRVGLRRWRRPVHAMLFWQRTSADPGDVDGVVNANVLAYLGDGPHAAPVATYLGGVLERGEEDRCDKWYRSAFVLHHAIARGAASGVTALAPLKGQACARITAAAQPDGRIGDGPLDTALAATALRDWGHDGPERAAALRYLIASQDPDGSWPAEPFYFGGPRAHPLVPCWGSRELTTGMCLAALV